jgi:hypothetical protein
VNDLIFLYDQVVESLARLHAFWSMRVNDFATHGDVEEDIDGVADLLAKRDLLIFAASAGNFAEACKALGEMRSRTVRTSKLLSRPRFGRLNHVLTDAFNRQNRTKWRRVIFIDHYQPDTAL